MLQATSTSMTSPWAPLWNSSHSEGKVEKWAEEAVERELAEMTGLLEKLAGRKSWAGRDGGRGGGEWIFGV